MADRVRVGEQSQDWFGIYQQNTEPPALSPRFLNVAHNMALQRGTLHSRPGLTQMNGVQFGSSGKRTIYGIDQWKTSSSDTLIVAAGDLIQSLPVTGGDPTTLTTSYPTSFRTSVTGAFTVFAHLGGLLFIVNGTDANVKYNGTNVTRMGLVAPSTLAAPVLAAGALTGTRIYKATLVSSTLNGSAESEPTSTTSVTYAGQQGTFSAPSVPNSDPQVDRWNLYATTIGTTTPFYRVNAAPVTLATTIVDNAADAVISAGTQIDTAGLNAVPPGNFLTLAVHQGRLVGSTSGNTLYWSDLGLDLGGIFAKPESWPAVNALEFPDSGGLKITALMSFYEWLIVWQQFGCWAIQGSLADEDERIITPLQVNRDYQGLGVFGQNQVVVMDNQVFFTGKNMPYKVLRRQSLVSSELVVEPLGVNIERLYQQVDFSTGAAACADRDNMRVIFAGKGRTV